MRSLADLLAEITSCEVAIGTGGDVGGYHAARIARLRQEVRDHPDAAKGKDLPPITGSIGKVL